MQKKFKHIVIIGPRGYPSQFSGTSGVETYIEQITQEWLRLDQQINFTIIVRTRYQHLIGSYPKRSRVKVIQVWSLPGKAFEAISYTVLAGLISCFLQADIVWYHTAGMAISAILPKLCHKKVWVTVHSVDWKRKKWSNFEQQLFFRGFRWIARRAVDKLFAVSQRVADEVTSHTHSPVTVTVAGLPKIHRPLRQLKYQQHLLFLGRLVPEKRIEWLLQFVVAHKLPCVVIGTHGNIPMYEQRLRKLFNQKNIEWRGMLFGDQKWSLLASAKLLVLPSELEGLPLSILEAVAVKTDCFVHKGMLPSEIERLPYIHVFNGLTYQSFERSLLKTLHRLDQFNKRKQPYPATHPRGLSKYEWGKTIRLYAMSA